MRVIQLGESPDRVFNAGAPGLDNINKTELLSKEELESRLHFKFSGKTALLTFHPATLDKESSGEQFRELLNALDGIRELKVIFTKPNADADGRIVIKMIDEYVRANNERAMSSKSLGKLNYLSAMKHADLVIGNSSSGIIEFPSFRKPTVNIGDRQRGRIKAQSIIDCRPLKGDIEAAIKKNAA